MGEDVVLDAILCAEHPFLEVRHVKVTARRLDDLGSVARSLLWHRIPEERTVSTDEPWYGSAHGAALQMRVSRQTNQIIPDGGCEVIACASRLHAWRILGGPQLRCGSVASALPPAGAPPAAPRVEILK